MRYVREIVVLLALAAGASAAASAQGGDAAARLDAYFASLAANRDFSGVVLVARGDSVLFRRAYGEASFELDAPNTPETRFRVASLTKTFTAAAVAMLAERGTLGLDDPLSRWLPGFPNGERITLRHLLLHRSGLANPDYTASFRERIGLEELVRRIAARPALFEPGTDGGYSNAGYNVLARVVEVASGVPYDVFLRREIFEPLGMTGTGSYGDFEIVRGRAEGYLPGPPPEGVVNAPWSDIGFAIGSGSLYSTVDDLHRWARAVHRERLFRRSALDYPHGWGRLGEDRKAGLEQTGLSTGFTSSLSVWFADSLYVVILGNVESAQWSKWPADVAAIVRGRPVESAPPRTVAAVRPEALRRFVGRYADGKHTIEVAEEHGHLWLYLDGWPVPKYLSPTGRPGEFVLRSDSGRVVFGEAGPDGGAGSLEWVFGEGSGTVYPRSRAGR